jgi:hypothetical protein
MPHCRHFGFFGYQTFADFYIESGKLTDILFNPLSSSTAVCIPYLSTGILSGGSKIALNDVWLWFWVAVSPQLCQVPP